MIPKVLSHKRLRKISVEVHRLRSGNVVAAGGGENEDGTYEECLVRFLQPANKATKRAAKEAHKHQQQHHHHHHREGASLAAPSAASSTINDDTSVAGVPAEYRPSENDYFAEPNFDKGWEAKYRFPIKCMSIKGTTGKSGVYVRVELGQHSTHTRQLIFDTAEEAQDFVSVVEQELKHEKERAEAKFRLAFSGKPLPQEGTHEKITYLFEIVSAWNLPAGDLYYSDPYVIVSLGGKEIHRTKYISKT